MDRIKSTPFVAINFYWNDLQALNDQMRQEIY